MRLTYTDGVESILFAVDLPPEPNSNGGNQIDPPYNPQSIGDALRVHSVGRTTAVQGTLHHREIMVLGKTDTELLLDLIQSALP